MYCSQPVGRDTTEQTVTWYALTLPLGKTANQTAIVYWKIVIIDMDAIVQKEVIRPHLTKTCILVDNSKIEKKGVFFFLYVYQVEQKKIFIDLN